MKALIINDTHLFGVRPACSESQVFDAIASCPEETLLVGLGDIVDVRNARRMDVSQAIATGELIRDAIVRAGGVCVRGNHELDQIAARDEDVRNGVYFAHGDIEFWGKAKADKFRQHRPLGAAPCKRLLSWIIDWFRFLKCSDANDTFRDWLSKHANVDTVVVGHRHPRRTIRGKIGKTQYVILKRGINPVDL